MTERVVKLFFVGLMVLLALVTFPNLDRLFAGSHPAMIFGLFSLGSMVVAYKVWASIGNESKGTTGTAEGSK